MSIKAKVAESGDLEDGDLELPEEKKDEEGLIRYYFFRGFEYKEIRLFLFKYHGIEMSLSTLKRRIKQYGLRRQRPDYDIDDVRESIQSIINGPGCLQGYRSAWHTLQLRGKRVPCIVVQELLREIDPDGSELRRAHRLKERKYHNPGPNYAWHSDGYDNNKILLSIVFLTVLKLFSTHRT
ncbi:hypothetical protein P5673_009971 [Acropora cervicornis]|uniref:Clr5 domain-containing protein n=1 Tax=Acropora cervicornis TaxID=6130 RepID=A0AAD9QRZ0_ACRCE|nr:hypothetical protein P5673_009971 [Acropora cervicornis]